jgi:hypothetical protein
MRYLVGLVFVLAVTVFLGCGDDDSTTALCESFCAKDTECYPEEQIEFCEQECRYELDVAAATSEACGSAVEGLFACVVNLPTCEAVNAYWVEIPSDSYPCKFGDDAVEALCLD